MTVELDKIPPPTRAQIEQLMAARGWTFSQAMNHVVETAVGEGALSVVGRRKAKVLKLVAPKRASERGSSG
ncbi:hypothetical protein [Pseudomonas typographi]|uniref:hypothetical protein n=1 Tax=Pseudomonas typographi TaxID=2715964 RepID=UPI001EEE5BAD|nr:hypothetical protein [Pseudomonas typographi]